VNDTLGHAAGDHVLREVADRLRADRRDGELVARLGGDEFIVLCPGRRSQHDADVRAKEIVRLFEAEFSLPDGTPLPVGVSVGIAGSVPGIAADVLLSHADIAMYEAKRTKSAVALFTDSLLDAHKGRTAMEQDLRGALAGGQMRLLYQPVLDVKTGVIIGSEALLRWSHTVRGSISPSRFVPVAEQIGVIGALGEFALYGALRQQRAWMDELGPDAPRFVAVNVSPVQLAAEGFVDGVVRALRTTGVPPTALTLEITESALIDDLGAAVDVIADLADMGIRLDIDYFGTGYSSLGYLVRLPVHALKIDKSFVWGLGNDDKIDKTVRALLNLAHGLGLHAVAEGVENESQLAWLREHGCDMAQGFFMSKALPGVDFGVLATDRPRW
jgi:diguanylate cyclase (GGDEF)-like protein